jgi:hypothetical protein
LGGEATCFSAWLRKIAVILRPIPQKADVKGALCGLEGSQGIAYWIILQVMSATAGTGWVPLF